jgi:hypothetical protein
MERLTILQRVRRKYKSIKSSRYESRKKDFLDKLINANRVVVLGNQKTGSTAIADLIAKRSGKTVALDIQEAIPKPTWQLEQRYGLAEFPDFLFEYASDFEKDIIKEPSLTFFYHDLIKNMPNAKFAYIIRDPFENIRSILNRLKVPGNIEDIEVEDWPEFYYMPTWKLAIDSTWLGWPKGNYIEALAYRWCEAADVYLGHRSEMHLIKYEEFLSDKAEVIDNACRYLNLEPKNDISEFLDRQYQKKGNHGVDLIEFFGRDNYSRIEDICRDRARMFGYDL